MASELRVNTLKDAAGANSVAMEYVAGGSAKVWANLNGQGTIATRDSFNVSGVTDNGTGNYTYALSSSMNNANYANTAMGNEGNAGDIMIDDANAVPTTSAIRVQARAYSGGGADDPDYIYHVVHGDLA